MERGQLQREVFMDQIAEMTRDIVYRAKVYESDTVPGDFTTLKVPCPKCGSVIKENYKKFQCQSCDFALWKIAAGRQFEVEEIEELIEKRVVGPLQGFRSKMGRPFAAIVKLTPELKAEFDFGQNNADANGVIPEVDFTGQESVGPCPKCGAPVYEHGMNYICQKATGPNRTCDYRSGKIILQRPIEREQMTKLLTAGRTDLLQKFISKKNNRPFSAFLVKQPEGKIGFEFAPRPVRQPKKKVPPKAPTPPAEVGTPT